MSTSFYLYSKKPVGVCCHLRRNSLIISRPTTVPSRNRFTLLLEAAVAHNSFEYDKLPHVNFPLFLAITYPLFQHTRTLKESSAFQPGPRHFKQCHKDAENLPPCPKTRTVLGPKWKIRFKFKYQLCAFLEIFKPKAKN